ncbi:MAG: hypothetical protein AAGA56_08165 [Myxococcota bacterium]
MNHPSLLRLVVGWCLGLSFVALQPGCNNDFDAPPQGSIVNLVDGILPDPSGTLTIAFDEEIVPETLRLRVVRLELDPEGNLLPPDQIPTLFSGQFEPSFNDFDVQGGRGVLYQGNTRFDINLFQTFPVGPSLAVVIEPGLRNTAGEEWKVQQILPFGFEFSCGEPIPTGFPAESFLFLVAEVEQPVGAQLQLVGDFRVDQTTGDFAGQLTNAVRDDSVDCGQFGLNCAGQEVCRTLPAPDCVDPSVRAATADEWPDYVVTSEPPVGYSFPGVGCVVDVEEDVFSFTNLPTDADVSSPDITVLGLVLNLEATRGADGLLRGGGTFTASEILLGSTSSGSGSGTVTFVEIPADQVPDGVVAPPVEPGQLLE